MDVKWFVNAIRIVYFECIIATLKPNGFVLYIFN